MIRSETDEIERDRIDAAVPTPRPHALAAMGLRPFRHQDDARRRRRRCRSCDQVKNVHLSAHPWQVVLSPRQHPAARCRLSSTKVTTRLRQVIGKPERERLQRIGRVHGAGGDEQRTIRHEQVLDVMRASIAIAD